MEVTVRLGDVLVCTANPTLGRSGGVNGALLFRGGDSIQKELKTYRSSRELLHVEPGTVVRTCPDRFR